MSSDVPTTTAAPSAQSDLYEVVLTPPTSAPYFSHTEFDYIPSDPVEDYHVKWHIEQYSYAVNSARAPTDPKFDGSIYVLLLHQVRARHKNGRNPYLWFKFTVGIDRAKAIRPVLHFPETGTGVPTGSGADLKYDFRWAEDFQILVNGGNDSTTFKARYADGFLLASQVSSGIKNAEVLLSMGGMNDWEAYRGISMFKCRSMKEFPAKFTFETRIIFPFGNGSLGNHVISLDLGFENRNLDSHAHSHSEEAEAEAEAEVEEENSRVGPGDA